MIIDKILDRKDNEADIARGFTHYIFNNERIPLSYDAARFYREIRDYGEIAFPITRAMDSGTEEDVKRELCLYVINNEYNPELCEYINSRNWLE